MIETIGKYIGGKVLAAGLAVASVLVVVWYWRLPLEARAHLWLTAQGVMTWIGFVAVLPWALFFVPAKVLRAESNAASGVALAAYLAVDLGFALYLTGGRLGDRWAAGVMVVGLLCAGFYNFLVCEFLAQRSEDST
jgi:hypothetical protein